MHLSHTAAGKRGGSDGKERHRTRSRPRPRSRPVASPRLPDHAPRDKRLVLDPRVRRGKTDLQLREDVPVPTIENRRINFADLPS